ncbi:hypothetical protein OW293_004695 [Providencia rettgeri]|uniref:hypothetical protein n=1 Tax=unclassified Providencia TaxID=2633465 RepID=UPI002274340C|nr:MULTISPECIES: hypothetical protein [unclassified Providencia]MDB9565901.1 hypothetical protein [Providencia rettgeri]
MSLAIIILLIIFVPAIPFFCLLKKRKWKFWLDESSLHVQPLFWFLVFLPLIISGIAWVLVAQDYELDVSTNGYSRLMENAKFPFLILALSPILGAFVTSAHRSLQTELQIKTAKEQLEEAQRKNKFDLYHSNKKFLKEEILSLRTKNDEGIIQVNQLYYKMFFIFDNHTDILIDSFFIDLNSYLVSLNKEINSFFDMAKKDLNNYYKNQNKNKLIRQGINGGTFYNSKRVGCINNINSKNDEIKNYLFIQVKFDFNEDIEKSIESHNKIMRSMNMNMNMNFSFDYYLHFKYALITEIRSTFDFIKMIALFTLENKNIYETLPALEEGYHILTKIEKNGDKVAAENPNSPE